MIRVVIRLYNNRLTNGMSIKKLLEYSDIARSTLYQWITKYSNILYNHLTDRIIRLRSYNKETIYKKINDQCVKDIIEYVSLNPIINTKKIKKMVLKKHKVSINKNYIYQILKKNNITYKKAQKQKYPYNLDKFASMKETLKQNITIIGNDIISIDETGIVLKRKNDYAWSKSGTKCTINEPNNYDLRYSMCMAINKDRIISYRLTKGTYNGRKYRNFLFNNVIEKTNNKGILMDNASIHLTKKIKEELTTKKIKVIYNVPYHPEFNPIEYLFNTLKSEIKNKYICNYKQLNYCINNFIIRTNKIGLSNYFQKSYNNLFAI